MSTFVITIVAIVSIVVWITVSQELIKPSKEKNKKKIITLISAGSLSTLILIISLFQKGTSFQFRKLAVLPDLQKMGIGNSLLNRVEEYAQLEGGTLIWCNARVSAIDFYLKAGYTHTGKLFSKNGFDYEILEKLL